MRACVRTRPRACACAPEPRSVWWVRQRRRRRHLEFAVPDRAWIVIYVASQSPAPKLGMCPRLLLSSSCRTPGMLHLLQRDLEVLHSVAGAALARSQFACGCEMRRARFFMNGSQFLRNLLWKNTSHGHPVLLCFCVLFFSFYVFFIYLFYR